MASQDFLQLDPRDNVWIAVRDLPKGTVLLAGRQTVRLPEPIPMGHKIAAVRLAAGQPILRYGHPIGVATVAITAGDWVHTHNLAIGTETPCYPPARATPPDRGPSDPRRTFRGYRRPTGRVGTRNYVAIIASVNCSATVAKAIAGHFDSSALREFPTIDGVIALTHTTGCGMPLGSAQHALLERVLRGMFRHPNIGAWLLVGLGCEQATADNLAECTDLLRGRTNSDSAAGAAAVLRMQECGGTQKTIAAGIEAVRRILPVAAAARREPVPVGEIVLATQCGGSDGNSGITANPALGVASDLLVAAGGTTILGETPEIYGAASLLTQRARSGAIAEKLVDRIQWWQRHAAAAGASLDQNPSVGNKEGGLTTIWEKSLGAVAKGGSTALEDVYLYAEPVTASGLVVMDTPGYDPVSVTGMVAGGANIVALTTGRGSCFGCAAAPTIKITSNTPTYRRMTDDMDIDAGVVLAGYPIAELGREIFELILAVAGGKQTRSEQLGVGAEEFVPWQLGPTL